MNSDTERTEYVLNEVGLYWTGNVNYFDTRRWDYGQVTRNVTATFYCIFFKPNDVDRINKDLVCYDPFP